jgi:hypothetical protein
MPNARRRRLFRFRIRRALCQSLAKCYEARESEIREDEQLGPDFRTALHQAAKVLSLDLRTCEPLTATSTVAEGVEHLFACPKGSAS